MVAALRDSGVPLSAKKSLRMFPGMLVDFQSGDSMDGELQRQPIVQTWLKKLVAMYGKNHWPMGRVAASQE